ncbi:hypothetical protein MUK42_27079 [Musa troglodytarum]|uniref:Uncharacterized protein n=1 Tax=Musa troglodytarum TaxID=320322 RepID=A0A9E7EB55_9LILI|nr:hypothetical protein MUK42_27079 [Musa troglodytarum]
MSSCFRLYLELSWQNTEGERESVSALEVGDNPNPSIEANLAASVGSLAMTSSICGPCTRSPYPCRFQPRWITPVALMVGEVSIFDSVSPEKVQVVLLLLEGREMNAELSPFPSSSMQNMAFDVVAFGNESEDAFNECSATRVNLCHESRNLKILLLVIPFWMLPKIEMHIQAHHISGDQPAKGKLHNSVWCTAYVALAAAFRKDTLMDRRKIPFQLRQMPSRNQMKQVSCIVMVVFLFQDSRFSSLRTTLLKLELPKPIVSPSMVTIHCERLCLLE